MSSTILSIGSNVGSLRAQRQLGTATTFIASSFERLGSGLRINRASDDAAGLAVASSLRADSRIYSQGVRNLNDGISALNIADGALSNLSSIVTRIAELAEQAANGSLGWRQRTSLDAEAHALANEYSRISKTTDFNGLRLLDGSVQGLSLQAGYGSGGSILSSLGGAMGTGTFQASTSYLQENGITGCSNGLALADLNGDGIQDMATAGTMMMPGAINYGVMTIRLGQGDGTFGAATAYSMVHGTANRWNALSISDVDGDGIPDILAAGVKGGLGSAYVYLGRGDGTFSISPSYLTESTESNALALGDINGDGALDLATAGREGALGRATIRLGNGDGTFRAALTYLTEDSGSYDLSLSDVNGDGMLDLITAGTGGGQGRATIRLGNGDGTFRKALSYSMEATSSSALSTSDVNGDGVLDLLTAGTGGGQGWATIRFGIGDGTFGAGVSYLAEASSSSDLCVSDVNGDGISDLLTAGLNGGVGRATIRLGNGDGTFNARIAYSTESAGSSAITMADLDGDGVLDLVTAGVGGGQGRATIRLSNTRDGISPILPFSLATLADARQAISMLRNTAESLSMQRGQIGAFQSRLAAALSTLGSTVLECKGAQARVEETDVASESANLVRQQILQRAASSMLAQANQGPALALMLLKK